MVMFQKPIPSHDMANLKPEIMKTVAPEGKNKQETLIFHFGGWRLKVWLQRRRLPAPALQSMAARNLLHVVVTLYFCCTLLLKMQRWNLHLFGSSAAGHRFQRCSLWETCSAGTLTPFGFYNIKTDQGWMPRIGPKPFFSIVCRFLAQAVCTDREENASDWQKPFS